MKCQYCTKKATVHLTEIIDGKVSELHLCEQCAREKSSQMEQEFGLGDLLAGLANFGAGASSTAEKSQKKEVACINCGMTYQRFKEIGRLGCSECYGAFHEEMNSLLRKIHGANRHLGKKPKRLPEIQDKDKILMLKDLKERLAKAVAVEDFEMAAQLRDEIKRLEE